MSEREVLEYWKGEALFWRNAFETARGLREDAEKEIREQWALIQRLEDRVWWLSGGY